MLDVLDQIEREALSAIEEVHDDEALQRWKVAHLGRSSPLMSTFDRLGGLPKEQRPAIGRRANQVKRILEASLNSREESLQKASLSLALRAEQLDVTLPGRRLAPGRLHPTTQTLRQIYRIFGDMGFQIYRSREIEIDEYNFELLNIPAHHPARDMWDTFYTTTAGVALRPHTSPGQIHVMREFAPEPIRVILPGMCYRYEQVSARKETQFNQVEGLAVGKDITMGDLKGTLSDFARRMFSQNVRIRFRASHFPFTEPSAEMDIECFLCSGIGCRVCQGSGWLEILGCGMVHPMVLHNGGYDPREYMGFAFGLGPERITMLRYHIEDIRYFWMNDIRFLEQY
jgi:phenylalanyl-tRNA synthetase alpha chain